MIDHLRLLHVRITELGKVKLYEACLDYGGTTNPTAAADPGPLFEVTQSFACPSQEIIICQSVFFQRLLDAESSTIVQNEVPVQIKALKDSNQPIRHLGRSELML